MCIENMILKKIKKYIRKIKKYFHEYNEDYIMKNPKSAFTDG